MKCVDSSNMFVSDRALTIFESNHFVYILKMYKKDIYPIIVPTMDRLASDKKQELLHDSFLALKNILNEMDPKAYKEALAQEAADNVSAAEKRKNLDKKWRKINK